MTLRGRSPTSAPNKPLSLWKKKKNAREYVLKVLPNDILLGRGPIDHKGNAQFRELIKERKQEYLSTNNRQAKVNVASDIVKQIYDNGGRFLKKLDNVKAANVLPKVLERLDKKEKDEYEGNFANHKTIDVYEIQGAATVMEKTKQALRQSQQKGPNGSRSRSPTSSSPQLTTPPSSNGFIGGDNNANATTTSRDFNNSNNGNTLPTGFNGLPNNNNNNKFPSSLASLNFFNKDELFASTGYNNNKISSSLGNIYVNTKEELVPINKDVAPTRLLPPLFSNNQKQQQQQQEEKHPNKNPIPLMSLQQQLYQLEQQQQLKEKQHRLEKKQYELQQLELERQKKSLQQNLLLKFQQDQFRKLQELQQPPHRQFNNQNSSNHTAATNNNNETNRRHPQHPQERKQKQGKISDDYNHNKEQQQQHSIQQHHNQQQQDQNNGVDNGYAVYTTTLEEMEDTRDRAAAISSNSNDKNDKGPAYALTRDLEHSLGDFTELLKKIGNDGEDTHEKNFDNMSTMMLSMNDLSVKDSEFRSSQSTLGTIDGVSDNDVLSSFRLSNISMMSMKNDSKDLLFQSKRVGCSAFKEVSQNASWDAAAVTGNSSNRGGTPKLGNISALLASDFQRPAVSSLALTLA